jgi:phage tail sheath protein FI
MPEYLAPGVYVEETSYRAKSIEGVATSTAGFVGQARFGPVAGLPTLVTSFEEFQRYFGSEDPLVFNGVPTTNHLGYAVRLFFENGGKRVYVARVFRPAAGGSVAGSRAASAALPALGARFLRARFPGRAGNLRVRAVATRGSNLLVTSGGARRVNGVRPGDIVEVVHGAAARPRAIDATNPIDPNNFYSIAFDLNGNPALRDAQDRLLDLNVAVAPGPDVIAGSGVTAVQKISLDLMVEPNGDGSTGPRADAHLRLSAHPDSDQFVGRVLRHEDPVAGIEPPADRTQRIYFDPAGALPSTPATRTEFARDLLAALLALPQHELTGGSDGLLADPTTFVGSGSGHDASGMAALAEIEDIAIVAAPGSAALADADRQTVTDALVGHCELLRYRFAVLAGPSAADQAAIREARGKHDSKYAAIYYPWLVVNAPTATQAGGSRETLLLSPEGAMAGIYARSDIERGVHKAPANEVVRGILRFFEGRGYRVWGARTISSDPEWTYVNVRRLFIYLEHSIDRGTQWAVFEPNNEQLWLKIRLTIENFLFDVWRTGALLGRKPEEAYFVRCDRTTMSQSDLDNGRLICLIGVAPTKPAEFVIFRIGQWTADASII